MTGRWWAVGILLAAVAGLGGWVYWIEHAPAPKSPPLAPIAPASVHHVVIERPGDRLEFERQENGWRMLQPFDAPAAIYPMEQLLALPKQTSHTRYAAAELDLARFGLVPPQVTVRLEDTEFRFGHQNPLSFQRYLQVGENLYLVDDTLFHQLTAPATAWIEPKLLPSGTLKELDLPDWHLTLKETGAWSSRPELPAADLERLADAWRTARAVQITPFTEKPPPQAARIRVVIDDQTLEFVLLQREPELILLRPDQQLRYHFYGATGQRLLIPRPESEAGTS